MLFLIFLYGCRDSEYYLFQPEKSNEEPSTTESPLDNTAEQTDGSQEAYVEDTQDVSAEDILPRMRIDASIQHMKWGQELMRCQIQVAFERRWYPPPPQEGQPPPSDPPQEAGDCVFEQTERPTGPPNPPQDNWFISGALSGPEQIYLTNEHSDIILHKTMAEDGLIRYEMSNCNQETFPFGETFDLEIPESEGNEAILEAYIEDVVAFGPDIHIETPTTIQPNHQYQGYGADGLYFSWSFADIVPSLAEERMRVRLTNNSNQPWDYNERMECIPHTREDIQLLGEDLLQFTLSQFIGEGIFSIGLNVHGDYYTPPREDPWGNLFQARVNIARGGMMEIAE